jgi:hypothetical protein
MMILKPICFNCKYFDINESKCPAFEGDIPDVILSGENDHLEPLPDQKNNIIFEQND